MTIEERISAFSRLGDKLKGLNEEEISSLCRRAKSHNSWYDEQYVKQAITGIAHWLNEEGLRQWLSSYTFTEQEKTVAIVMAGNIPLVGFHDMLCVLIAGHKAQVKLSSQDPFLPKQLFQYLVDIEAGFAEKVQFVEIIKNFDAVIATGSDATFKHFDYYFAKYPRLLRHNRNSIAVLTGEESEEELSLLSKDIADYYGLGCRNVSFLFVPEQYDLKLLLDQLQARAQSNLNNHKYANNYDYNKSILLVNGMHHLDTGGLLLVESEQIASPISVLHYQQYQRLDQVKQFIREHEAKLQCVVSKADLDMPFAAVDFGNTQCPNLSDYADREDSMHFLESL